MLLSRINLPRPCRGPFCLQDRSRYGVPQEVLQSNIASRLPQALDGNCITLTNLGSASARPQQTRSVMPKRAKQQPQERGSVLFDVVYEDGSRASNRRVPMEILGGFDGDEPARQLIEEQDEAIGQKSGRPRSPIQSLTRTPTKAPKLAAGER